MTNPNTPSNNIDFDGALEALESMDDFARMDVGVAPHGPYAVLRDFITKARQLHANATPPVAAAPVVDYKALYLDLIYQVGNKYPGESRHDTAKKYIIGAESNSAQMGDAAALNPGVGGETK